ncbi:MAG: NAD-dependent epimerase/dehydratase family protein [Actinobacteria bacterium]|uniref:GDP-mannose 4,6-dehydratase n=1 Tax=freshwater metagenome TaxID=449393 RepID=A0A6J5ZBS3_9ZZZZ|nr:NAD-dependent epimerase/dehydratase family protein [Actinomycetota bacterium]
MPRALITGIGGQDGSYLAELLLADGYEVVGFGRAAGLEGNSNLAAVADRVSLLTGDLLEPGSLARAVEEAEADEIYHMAAPTFVPDSWNDPSETMTAIVGSTAEMLAAAVASASPPRIWLSASAEIFGDTDRSPQDELSLARPRSPYGVAKLAALGLLRTMREQHGLFACGGILYNHESPRRPLRFLPRKVTRGAAAIALGQQEQLVLGDLDATRDWSDARDVVGGAVLAMRAEVPRDYVLASGVGHSVRELVEIAFDAAGIGGEFQSRVSVDPQFVRPPEAVAQLGDPGLAERELGWERRFSFEQTIAEMVAADLADLGG